MSEAEILSVSISIGVPRRPASMEVILRPGNRAEVIERFPTGEIRMSERSSIDALIGVLLKLVGERAKES